MEFLERHCLVQLYRETQRAKHNILNYFKNVARNK